MSTLYSTERSLEPGKPGSIFVMKKVHWLKDQCHRCGRQLNSWDMRLTRTFKVVNTCEHCFCEIYDMDAESFRAQMEDFFGMRPCQGI